MKIRVMNAATRKAEAAVWSFNSYLAKFSETKLGYLNHIQFRPNPLAN
jgi:hypothetical protein